VVSKNKNIATDKRSLGGCNGSFKLVCGRYEVRILARKTIEVLSFILSTPPTTFMETGATADLFQTLPHSSFPRLLTVYSVYAVRCKRNHEKKKDF